ncbi:MAG: MOSC N-terminal beta barrel domain-containing protein [Rubrivivax sp.]
MSDLDCRLHALYVHPVKSCAGLAVDEALLIETGLQFDRAWMVVDPEGRMVTQRDLPRMALVKPQLRLNDLVLRAPGMLALHLSLDHVEQPTTARVWDDEVKAYSMGALADQWFSDCLGRPLRLVRFDPDQKRLSSRRWTGSFEAENAFSDGFPLLVAGSASLADLNARLAARGVAPVGMERFRPNLVIEGLEAWEEDHLESITLATDEGPVVLRLVKPCVRCTIPSVDPATGVQGHEPGDTLSSFRADARMGGGITFAMNAVIEEGIDCVLKPGQAARARIAF